VLWCSNFALVVRLTNQQALSKVYVGRASGLFCCLQVGGRTIGSTSDSGSDYPGSSPGLPANLTQEKIR
jgi:hypothetical protein